jgi:glycerophosphoryl diester phosphodiesterase
VGADPRDHGRAADELRMFAAAGVDGLFTDFPGEAVAALG